MNSVVHHSAGSVKRSARQQQQQQPVIRRASSLTREKIPSRTGTPAGGIGKKPSPLFWSERRVHEGPMTLTAALHAPPGRRGGGGSSRHALGSTQSEKAALRRRWPLLNHLITTQGATMMEENGFGGEVEGPSGDPIGPVIKVQDERAKEMHDRKYRVSGVGAKALPPGAVAAGDTNDRPASSTDAHEHGVAGVHRALVSAGGSSLGSPSQQRPLRPATNPGVKHYGRNPVVPTAALYHALAESHIRGVRIMDTAVYEGGQCTGLFRYNPRREVVEYDSGWPHVETPPPETVLQKHYYDNARNRLMQQHFEDLAGLAASGAGGCDIVAVLVTMAHHNAAIPSEQPQPSNQGGLLSPKPAATSRVEGDQFNEIQGIDDPLPFQQRAAVEYFDSRRLKQFMFSNKGPLNAVLVQYRRPAAGFHHLISSVMGKDGLFFAEHRQSLFDVADTAVPVDVRTSTSAARVDYCQEINLSMKNRNRVQQFCKTIAGASGIIGREMQRLSVDYMIIHTGDGLQRWVLMWCAQYLTVDKHQPSVSVPRQLRGHDEDGATSEHYGGEDLAMWETVTWGVGSGREVPSPLMHSRAVTSNDASKSRISTRGVLCYGLEDCRSRLAPPDAPINQKKIPSHMLITSSVDSRPASQALVAREKGFNPRVKSLEEDKLENKWKTRTPVSSTLTNMMRSAAVPTISHRTYLDRVADSSLMGYLVQPPQSSVSGRSLYTAAVCRNIHQVSQGSAGEEKDKKRNPLGGFHGTEQECDNEDFRSVPSVSQALLLHRRTTSRRGSNREGKPKSRGSGKPLGFGRLTALELLFGEENGSDDDDNNDDDSGSSNPSWTNNGSMSTGRATEDALAMPRVHIAPASEPSHAATPRITAASTAMTPAATPRTADMQGDGERTARSTRRFSSHKVSPRESRDPSKQTSPRDINNNGASPVTPRSRGVTPRRGPAQQQPMHDDEPSGGAVSPYTVDDAHQYDSMAIGELRDAVLERYQPESRFGQLLDELFYDSYSAGLEEPTVGSPPASPVAASGPSGSMVAAPAAEPVARVALPFDAAQSPETHAILRGLGLHVAVDVSSVQVNFFYSLPTKPAGQAKLARRVRLFADRVTQFVNDSASRAQLISLLQTADDIGRELTEDAFPDESLQMTFFEQFCSMMEYRI